MKYLRLFLVTVLVCAGLGATAYAAGLGTDDLTDPGESESTTAAAASSRPQVEADDTVPGADAALPTQSPAPLERANVLEPGDSGEKVRALQHRLYQLAWFPERTTGTYGKRTRQAIAGFQGKRGFTQTGVVDPRTWRRLVAMSEQPTHDQKFNNWKPGPTLVGPGGSNQQVREVQARLVQIEWLSDVSGTYDDTTAEAVRGFQEKRRIPVTGEIDERTMDRLEGMTTEPARSEMYEPEPTQQQSQPSQDSGVLDPRCLGGEVLCIDKTTKTLRWVVDGEVRMSFDVRFGRESLPTREGAFDVNFKSRDHVSSLYDAPMPYAMFFSGGQAVHYSPEFAAEGYNGASHGCVNVRDKSAITSLFGQVDVGDTVIVYWS